MLGTYGDAAYQELKRIQLTQGLKCNLTSRCNVKGQTTNDEDWQRQDCGGDRIEKLNGSTEALEEVWASNYFDVFHATETN